MFVYFEILDIIIYFVLLNPTPCCCCYVYFVTKRPFLAGFSRSIFHFVHSPAFGYPLSLANTAFTKRDLSDDNIYSQEKQTSYLEVPNPLLDSAFCVTDLEYFLF